VASRAGVTKGLLYHYFPGGKVDLFKSAIGTCLGPALAEAGRMAGDFQGSGGDLLRALIELGYARVEMEQREYILLKLLLTEADRFPELAEFYRAEILQPALALVRGAVQAGVASGEFRPGAADEPGLAYVLLAPIFMGSIWRMMLGVDGAPDLGALREAHLELALRGLRP
jgi:AcrR family transcriptional regulator